MLDIRNMYRMAYLGVLLARSRVSVQSQSHAYVELPYMYHSHTNPSRIVSFPFTTQPLHIPHLFDRWYTVIISRRWQSWRYTYCCVQNVTLALRLFAVISFPNSSFYLQWSVKHEVINLVHDEPKEAKSRLYWTLSNIADFFWWRYDYWLCCQNSKKLSCKFAVFSEDDFLTFLSVISSKSFCYIYTERLFFCDFLKSDSNLLISVAFNLCYIALCKPHFLDYLQFAAWDVTFSTRINWREIITRNNKYKMVFLSTTKMITL